jgi:F0F1-type ATP synthase membrane subunit c/vacuolar-type H+-ATPase subunit K
LELVAGPVTRRPEAISTSFSTVFIFLAVPALAAGIRNFDCPMPAG